MINVLRCPECGAPNHVFAALNESLLAISSDLAIEAVLQKLVDVARGLIHSSFGALGVADERDGFRYFVTSPTTGSHGTPIAPAFFSSFLHEELPLGTSDVHVDPRFAGWPSDYLDLKSLLWVPIASTDEIVGGFYLGNENTWGFTPEHQSLVELLAPHAAIAIKNAHLYEQSRELSVVQERNRLARELHDSVTQTLFSMKLAAESANVLIDNDTTAARAQLAHMQELARQASTEMRSLVFELRPPELEIEGLIPTLRKHIEVLRRVHSVDIELHHRGDQILNPVKEKEVFRIIQEALNNAVRHANAAEIVVEVVIEDDKLRVSVADDGVGFDPDAPRKTRRLGLLSMSERAQGLGVELSVSSRPGRGTVVALELRS